MTVVSKKKLKSMLLSVNEYFVYGGRFWRWTAHWERGRSELLQRWRHQPVYDQLFALTHSGCCCTRPIPSARRQHHFTNSCVTIYVVCVTLTTGYDINTIFHAYFKIILLLINSVLMFNAKWFCGETSAKLWTESLIDWRTSSRVFPRILPGATSASNKWFYIANGHVIYKKQNVLNLKWTIILNIG